MRWIALAALLGAGVSACVSTQEMPLAPNMVRLDTQAAGALFVGHAADLTMKRAAEVTLQNGYTHFRLENAQMGQGSELAGVYSSGSASAFGTGYSSTAYGSGFSMPIYASTAEVGVTVIMFHANDPGAKGAFDAVAVLKKYGG